MSALQFLSDNVRAGTMLSFVYNGGSNPGTRRTVEFVEMDGLLRDGTQGFRALHDRIAKLYSVDKCCGMQIVDPDSNSDADDDDRATLRSEIASLKRQLSDQAAELDSLKRMRSDVVAILSGPQDA